MLSPPISSGRGVLAADTAKDASNLRLRILSAIVFVPGVLLLVEAAEWTLYFLVLGVAARCSWEFYQILEEAGYRPLRLPGCILVMGVCSYFWRLGKGEMPAGDLIPLLMAVTVMVMAWTLHQSGTERYTANAFLTLGGVLFFGILGGAPLLLVQTAGQGEEARHLVSALFLCIWLADSGAYFSGRLWGKTKLAPTISPGKTRVGFVGGIVGSMSPLALGFLLPSFSLWALAGLLLIAGVGGQLGDLVESAFKRDMGIKDAPPLIPGHGGLLDRFDSYFFAFPLACLYVDMLAIFEP